MNYKHGGLLPKSDPAYANYEDFLNTFSADGNVIVVATQGKELYTPANFKQWYELGNDLKTVHGIDSVFSGRTSSLWCATTVYPEIRCEAIDDRPAHHAGANGFAEAADRQPAVLQGLSLQ